MGIVAAVIGSAVLGAGATVYSSSEQTKASNAANTTNAANVSTANDQNWTNYLLSRGISTGSVVPAGTLPSGGTTAVNTKLPLWATINVPNSVAGPGGSPAGGYNLNAALGSGGGGAAPGGSPVAQPGFGYSPPNRSLVPGAAPNTSGVNVPPNQDWIGTQEGLSGGF